MTINLKNKIYTDENEARKHLEALQWPQGPVCPHCGVIGEATKLAGKSTRPGVWKCRACEKPFSVTVGTVFERSKIPLTKWLLATELLTSSKKGISAHQIHRMLGITYKTAWFMMHRIREAMAPVAGTEPPLGGYGKIVEADETYIGKADGKRKRPKEGGYRAKMKVLSLVERGGNIRSKRIKDGTKLEITDILRSSVHPDSILHTDGAGLYTNTGAVRIHESVDHNKQYVRDGKAGRKVHTNTLEGFYEADGEKPPALMSAIFEHIGTLNTARNEIVHYGGDGSGAKERRVSTAIKSHVKKKAKDWPVSAKTLDLMRNDAEKAYSLFLNLLSQTGATDNHPALKRAWLYKYPSNPRAQSKKGGKKDRGKK